MAKTDKTGDQRQEITELESARDTLNAELLESREQLAAMKEEVSSAMKELGEARAKVAADQEIAQKIILKHEALSQKERKLACRSVDPQKQLQRTRSVWAETADENNMPPEDIATHTFRVTTKPLGLASPVPGATVSNCNDEADAQCTYFRTLGVSPSDYSTQVSRVSTQKHKLAAA